MISAMLKSRGFKIPELRYERIYWALFFLIVITILYGAVDKKKSSFAQELQVNVIPLEGGDRLISEKDVKNALNRSFGTSLGSTELARLEVERIERALEEDPFVLNADSYVDQHNVLHVRIEQRAPLVRILDNHGDNYYLAPDGVRMPPSKNFTAHVLVATGNIPIYTPDYRDQKKNKINDLMLLCETIQADDILRAFIQQIHINNAGEFILVPLVGDQKIILGSIKNLEDKIERLKIFYKEGMPYAGWSAYKSINLAIKGQVICKK
ncbi:MAG: hypothetical protein R2792_13865 [Saprospiraceae bacterium]|jgi:cell division protein FtsQ